MMMNAAPDLTGTANHACESLPPLELDGGSTDIWGMPWDRQQAAALAWQAAGANADSDWDRWQAAVGAEMVVPALPEVGGPSAHYVGGTRPTMGTIMRMNTLLVSLRERLQQIQIEAANVAIAEMSRRHLAVAEAALAAGTLQPLPELHDDHAERIEALVRSSFGILAAAHGGMATIANRAAAPARPFVERRQQSVMIDFPDRRHAA